MKKNKMLRIASILLVVTLLSTCVISGTFAKYVTKAEGKDEARVAKWGILVSVNGDSAFATEYETHDTNGYDGPISVKADEDIDLLDMDEPERLVAPGTFSEGLDGTVIGKPEVATRYELKISDWTDIVLPQGTYTDYTNYVLGEGYKKMATPSSGDYAPVKWDIVVTKNKTGDQIGLLSEAAIKLGKTDAQLAEMGLRGFSASDARIIVENYRTQLISLLESIVPSGKNADIQIDGDDIILSMDFDPLKEVDYTFSLKWEWAFEGPTVGMTGPTTFTQFSKEEVDVLDTFLGNWIAYEAMVKAGEDASTVFTAEQIAEFDALDDENFKIGATVVASATQID